MVAMACGELAPPAPRHSPAHLSRPQPMVIESVVVLRAVPRSIAVAMRFEFAIDRWQAAQVAVL